MNDEYFQKKLYEIAKLPNAPIMNQPMGKVGGWVWVQPHNSRFYLFFKGSGYGWRKDGQLLNGGSEVLFRGFEGVCDIRLKRVQAEIFVNTLEKQWFQVHREDFEVAVEVLKRRLRDEALRVWGIFCKKYDIQSDGVIIKERVEIGHRSDLSRLNPALVIEGLDWKKVYAYKEEALSWDALVEKNKEERDILRRIEGKMDEVKQRLPELPEWRKACVALDLVNGDPRRCLVAWKDLDGYDKEKFLDYWMENYIAIGVRR